MHATAAVVREPGGPFVIEELEIGEPGPLEVLVKMVAVGLCHTDVVVRDQWIPVPLPAVLGHEGAGIVEAVGSRVSRVTPGDHVVLSSLSCGACPRCLAGHPTYCSEFADHNFSGSRPDGTSCARQGGSRINAHFFGQSSFSSYALAHERNTIRVPGDLSLETLGPLGCGIKAGVGSVLNALRPSGGSTIAIFGSGAVGLSSVIASVVVGCTEIIAVDRYKPRLELARELGATTVIDASEVDPCDVIREETTEGVDYALDTTGVASVVRQAVDSLTPTGTCGLVGASPPGTDLVLDMHSVFAGRTVRGIVGGDSVPRLFIPKMIDLHRAGRLPFDRLISFYDFGDINRAVEDSELGRVIKPVLRFDHD